MQSSMSNEPRDRAPVEDRPYRLYRADEPGSGGRKTTPERPYTVYRSAPRGLMSRLRGEDDLALEDERRGRGGEGRPPGDGRRQQLEPTTPWWRRRLTPKRVLAYLAVAVAGWLLLSFVLFMVSAQVQSGSIPAAAQAALTSGGNMLTSTDTVLVLGTDQRPAGSKEPGADTSDKGSRSDTIMLWRIGGGVSRRLSIPRDTLANIPGYGQNKINAAYAYGGPALAVKTIEQFTGIKINHLIIVNLANFPKFIDAIGGVDVTTGRICSNISGGASNGGFTLYLSPGTHHLSGIQALTLARTRENSCNAASTDLTREGYQQKILNAIKSQLMSPSTFFRLPWASWYAPQAVRTDMGGLTLLTLFAASEMGGSAPTQILKPTGSVTSPTAGDALVASPAAVHRAVDELING
jgi:LCP family protein required for cell wall assembly